MAWWLGAPYLKSAPENLDALDVARVSKVVQFSSESSQPRRESRPVGASSSESKVDDTAHVLAGEKVLEQWVTAHPGLVMTLGGVLILLSLVIASWAFRQLLLVERERQSNAERIAERYRVAPSRVVRAEAQSAVRITSRTGSPAPVESRREKNSVQLHGRTTEGASIPVPRAEPPKLHLIQTRSTAERPLAAPKRNGKRRRPDFDRIISEMALAQTTLSRNDDVNERREDGDSDKTAA